MRVVPSCLLFLLTACSQPATNKVENSVAETKQHLLSLERKWIEAEFALDTAYIGSLLDSTFFSVNAEHISNKQQEINGIYANISVLRKDSIFLDSLKLEDAVVNLYGDAAVTSFISHTYKKDKGRPTEKRMRFYDVWVKRDEEWKAVSSQGTVIAD
jgi:hypothetical protein